MRISSRARKILGIGLFVSITLGIIASLVLVQRTQDTRQQASETLSATITTRPAKGTSLTAGTQHSIDLVLQTPLGKKISGIQLVTIITPAIGDLTFQPASIPGLQVAAQTIESTSNGKKITLALLSQPSQPFTTTQSTITLGTLKFTPTTAGTLTIAPSIEDSKMEELDTGTNLFISLNSHDFQISTSPSASPISTPPVNGECNTPTCRADMNQDGILDAQDYSILVNLIRENFFADTNACWNTTEQSTAAPASSPTTADSQATPFATNSTATATMSPTTTTPPNSPTPRPTIITTSSPATLLPSDNSTAYPSDGEERTPIEPAQY